MMNRRLRLTLLLTLALSLLAPTVCFAQDGEEVEVKSMFYEFPDQLVDGHIKGPNLKMFTARKQVKIDRLVSLKKSFMPRIEATAHEDALK